MIHSAKLYGCTAIAALLVLAVSCAEEPTSTKNDSNKRFIDAWVSVNHPTAKKTDLGVFILDDQPGSGAVVDPEDKGFFVFANTTVTDIEGNVTSTSSEALSKQVGSYSKGNYYGATALINDKNYLQAGVYEMLKGMRVGGTRTALVPGWLNVIKDYGTAWDYLKNCTGDDAIYTITIEDQTDVIFDWEVKAIESFVAERMERVDSTFRGYYSLQLTAPTDTVKLPRDTAIFIDYTGRLLNGQVFDTTIKDTAKVHGIYSPSRTYEPVKATLNEEYTSITIGSSQGSGGTVGSEVVNGFAYCLSELGRYEKRVCVFCSDLGYGRQGAGKSIPAFCPISFEVEMVDDPEQTTADR